MNSKEYCEGWGHAWEDKDASIMDNPYLGEDGYGDWKNGFKQGRKDLAEYTAEQIKKEKIKMKIRFALLAFTALGYLALLASVYDVLGSWAVLLLVGIGVITVGNGIYKKLEDEDLL